MVKFPCYAVTTFKTKKRQKNNIIIKKISFNKIIKKINRTFSLWVFSFLTELTNNQSETKAKINS